MKNSVIIPRRFLAPVVALALALSICTGSLMNLPSHAQGNKTSTVVVDPATKSADDLKKSERDFQQ
jgi:hypothetical protein